MSELLTSEPDDMAAPLAALIHAALATQQPLCRLEDRIRELSVRVVDAAEDQIEPYISELKAALREHNGRLRKLAASGLARHRQLNPNPL